MLNIDLAMQNGYDARNKRKKTGSGDDEEEPDAPFHFIALLPIRDEVWKLDGLNRQPQRLGVADENHDWLSLAVPYVRTLIETASDSDGPLEFSLLALVQDPLTSLRAQLVKNMAQLRQLEQRLDSTVSDWRNSPMASLSALNGNEDYRNDSLHPSLPHYGISDEDIAAVRLPAEVETSAERLLNMWRNLITAQSRLRTAFSDEQKAARADEQRAWNRRHDYGPMIYAWLKMLADKEVLKDLVDQAG